MSVHNTDNIDLNKSASIEVVEYTGNGKYGQSNPTIIEFSFKPKVIVIAGDPFEKNAYVYGETGATYKSGSGAAGSSSYRINMTWTGKRLSCYVTATDGVASRMAVYQFNGEGTLYKIIAIG